MSLLADLYICRDDAEALKYDSVPSHFQDREQYTSFTVLELSTLWSLMRAVEWDDSLLDEFPTVLMQDDGARSIFRLPSAMTEALAQTTTDQVSTLARDWAATEELACAPGDVKPIIQGLTRLAQRAMGTGRNIFWNCV